MQKSWSLANWMCRIFVLDIIEHQNSFSAQQVTLLRLTYGQQAAWWESLCSDNRSFPEKVALISWWRSSRSLELLQKSKSPRWIRIMSITNTPKSNHIRSLKYGHSSFLFVLLVVCWTLCALGVSIKGAAGCHWFDISYSSIRSPS